MSNSLELRRVVIIGNGFDLQLRFQTSFRDYLESEEFNSISKSNSLRIFIREKRKTDKNWSDLEGALPLWLEWNSKKGSGKYAVRSDYEKVPSSRDEFIELKTSIEKFLRRIVPSRYKSNYRTSILLNHWLQSTHLTVFNFNFTDSFQYHIDEVLKGEFHSNYSHYHVHGTLEAGRIIIGADRDEKIGENRFILKSTAADYEPPNDYHAELSRATHVDIFGHSLGNSDSSYFEGFFNMLLNESEYSPQVRIFTKDDESCELLRSQLNSFIDNKLGNLQTSKNVRFIRSDNLSDLEFNEILSVDQ